jgi:hypothetical protein
VAEYVLWGSFARGPQCTPGAAIALLRHIIRHVQEWRAGRNAPLLPTRTVKSLWEDSLMWPAAYKHFGMTVF